MTTTLVAEPIRAWKVARIGVVPGHLPHEWHPRLVPVTARHLVTLDAEAVCHRGTTLGTIDHPPEQTPHADCRCGYYAKPDRTPPTLSAVALRVELSGRVVEHEDPSAWTGAVYRAQRQRVVAIEVPDECPCGATAVGVELLGAGHSLDRFGMDHASVGLRTFWPACRLHAAGRDVWTLHELATLYGVDVSWTADHNDGWVGTHVAAMFSVTTAAAASAMHAFTLALNNATAQLGTLASDLAGFAAQLDSMRDHPDDEHDTRRDSETVLEWKARRDAARTQRLDALYGPPRPPRHAALGRRTSPPHARARRDTRGRRR